MNEQFYIDWINSLDIPESVLIDKVEDIINNNDILLKIISNILNKNIEEMMIILGKLKTMNSLKNISLLMNIYFDYNYDCSNKEYLNENTYKLIQFLKSRYPKDNNLQKKMIYSNNSNNSNNYDENTHNKNKNKNKNNNEESTNYQKKECNKNNKKNILNKDYRQYVFKTTPNIYFDSDNNNNNGSKIINKSYDKYSNSNEILNDINITKKNNNSFNKGMLNLITNKCKRKKNNNRSD